MTTCNDEQMRAGAPCPRQSPARSIHAPVVGPLVLSSAVQVAAVTTAVLVGLPLLAVVGVVVAVAALTGVIWRRTISSLIAGAGLRVAQPYGPGEQIRVFVPALGAVEDAEIVRVGPANTTLQTARGVVRVPNADMLRGGTRR